MDPYEFSNRSYKEPGFRGVALPATLIFGRARAGVSPPADFAREIQTLGHPYPDLLRKSMGAGARAAINA